MSGPGDERAWTLDEGLGRKRMERRRRFVFVDAKSSDAGCARAPPTKNFSCVFAGIANVSKNLVNLFTNCAYG